MQRYFDANLKTGRWCRLDGRSVLVRSCGMGRGRHALYEDARHR